MASRHATRCSSCRRSCNVSRRSTSSRTSRIIRSSDEQERQVRTIAPYLRAMGRTPSVIRCQAQPLNARDDRAFAQDMIDVVFQVAGYVIGGTHLVQGKST